MNRLVRIALTLFISATIMVFLISRRLQALPKLSDGDRKSLSPSELERINNEVAMVNIGFVLIAAMLLAGLVLIITAIVRARKQSAAANSNHG